MIKRMFRVVFVSLFLIVMPVLAAQAEIREVCFREHCYRVEVVEEESERARGLQFRDSLEREAGMLFVFPSVGVYPFWMKDTLIPLDIVWLDEEKRVVDMALSVPPCRSQPCPVYRPRGEARYVLEVNAGEMSLLKIQPGDSLEFR